MHCLLQPCIHRLGLPFYRVSRTYISSVGHRTSRLVGLNRAKGVVLRSGALLGQEIEETRFAHVGQTDAPHLQVLADPSKRNDIVLDGFNLLWRHRDYINDIRMNTAKLDPGWLEEPRISWQTFSSKWLTLHFQAHLRHAYNVRVFPAVSDGWARA